MKTRRLNSSDYYWAFTISEIIFLVFGLVSRFNDRNYMIPAIIFMIAGITFAIKAYDTDHPGRLTADMGD